MFADRIDRPLLSERDIKGVAFDAPGFGMRLWSTRWYAWVVMSDLASQGDWLKKLGGFALLGKGRTPWRPDLDRDISQLRNMAINERANALDEIVTEADEFISKFLHLVSATATTHPATARMLIVADALTALITMHYKAHFNRPRPTQVVPGLMSPIQHGGHASFPSGHATQSHAFAALLAEVVPQMPVLNVPGLGIAEAPTIRKTLVALADRISRNREIAGLHYPSDTKAGLKLAQAITEKILLDKTYLPKFAKLVENARKEWEDTGVFDEKKAKGPGACEGEKHARE
jgi:membrane-associated phospholipid phosphatase